MTTDAIDKEKAAEQRETEWRAECAELAKKEVASGKRIYHVSTTLDVDLVVLASSEEEAEEVGKAHWLDEVQDCGLEPNRFHVDEVTNARQLKWLGKENLEGVPYGPDDQDSPQRSIEEYLAAMGVS